MLLEGDIIYWTVQRNKNIANIGMSSTAEKLWRNQRFSWYNCKFHVCASYVRGSGDDESGDP